MDDELEKYNEYLRKCFKEDPPPCRCLCPFKLDARSFAGKLARGNFDSAYREYRNTVIFPEIVSRVCEAPCEAACVRYRNGEQAVSLKGLEAACLAFSRDRKTVRYDLPVKPDRIAVVGGGPSGLACALKLAARNFPVTMFFAGAETGGALAGSSAADVYRAEIDAELFGLPIEYRPNTRVNDIAPLFDEGFRAVYIATGRGGETFGALEGFNPDSLGSGMPGVFIGGEALGVSAVQAIEHGSRASRSIEKFLQTGAMDGMPETYGKWPVNELYYREIPKSPPAGTGEKEGAASEAGRCAACECSACIDVCPMLEEARRTPKKLASDVSVTINKIEQQTRRIANRLINACNICGLCKEVCPAGVDIGECMKEARKALFKQGGLPPAFHDYYLRDMAQAISDDAYFEYLPESAKGYLFFPGCQTGASSPEYVLRPFEALREKAPDAGILVSCCGAPAAWAGDEALAEESMAVIRRVWESAGRPTLVCSCLSCRNRLSESAPDIPAITYFEWMYHAGVAPQGAENGIAGPDGPLYVFDPCAARYDDEAESSVRGLLESAGASFQAGAMSGKLAECCGFGGHIFASNPGLYDRIARERVSESELPYVAYCSNCRDAFAAQGKSCLHIFDLMFGIGNADRPAPGIAKRRENRRILKNRLSGIYGTPALDEIPAIQNEGPNTGSRLIIPAGLERKIERELLSTDELQMIVRAAEDGCEKLRDAETGRFIAHGRVGESTCWVVYEKVDDGSERGALRLVNLYTHRLRAVEEA